MIFNNQFLFSYIQSILSEKLNFNLVKNFIVLLWKKNILKLSKMWINTNTYFTKEEEIRGNLKVKFIMIYFNGL